MRTRSEVFRFLDQLRDDYADASLFSVSRF